MPALIFATAAIGRARPGSLSPRREDLVSLVFVVAAAGAAWAGVRAEADHALLMNLFARGAGRAAIAFAASAALLWWGRRGGTILRRCVGAAAIVAIAAAAGLRVFDETARAAWGGHFEAVYHPMVQVMLGKTVLVNTTSQYGLFPHFLAPIFAATGLSVLTFTAVLAILVAAVLAGIWGVLRARRRTARSRRWA